MAALPARLAWRSGHRQNLEFARYSPSQQSVQGSFTAPLSLSTRSSSLKIASIPRAFRRPFLVQALYPRQTCFFAADVKTQPMSFQFGETSFSVSFTPELAQQLKAGIDQLLQTFREKEKATRPQRWPGLEFRHSGDGISVEIFCNPNAYSNAFQAKALVTVKTENLRITSEGPLSAVKTSVDEYLASH